MKKISCYTYTFSRTIPLAWEAPPKGLAFRAVPKCAFLYPLSCHLWSRRWFLSLRAVLKPLGFPWKKQVIAIEWLGWRFLFIRVSYVAVIGKKYEIPQYTCALTHLPPLRTNEEKGSQCTAWVYTDYYGISKLGHQARDLIGLFHNVTQFHMTTGPPSSKYVVYATAWTDRKKVV